MPRDSRMSRVLHVLIHLDLHLQRPTSQEISEMLGTNAVVVRRTMAGLRDKGFITSEKGHGGGWELASDLDSITLLDVYQAIGEPVLFNIGPHADRADCLVEQAVNSRMEETLGELEELLYKRLAAITVADVAADYKRVASAGPVIVETGEET